VTETHEPDVPSNWPEGHVSSRMTGDEAEECICVTIHGVDHYLHSTTARELHRSVGRTLYEWNKATRRELKKHGVKHGDV